MFRPFEAARYTGTRAWAPMTYGSPGHCRRCGAPSGDCRCGCRECRREAKELLVQPAAKQGDTAGATPGAAVGQLSTMTKAMLERVQPTGAEVSPQALQTQNLGTATAFIGGGCCVSLSVEYAASVTTQPFIVLIEVTDSEGTAMLWARQENAGTPYRVKEGVITTKPGAKLVAMALNATARVRWCEIFICGC
ncbi:MAG: hypothetical protein M0002_14900 [Rhodospirillales bacterium]|nr:hypothetical protein [Rhodospirillales bacterium]